MAPAVRVPHALFKSQAVRVEAAGGRDIVSVGIFYVQRRSVFRWLRLLWSFLLRKAVGFVQLAASMTSVSFLSRYLSSSLRMDMCCNLIEYRAFHGVVGTSFDAGNQSSEFFGRKQRFVQFVFVRNRVAAFFSGKRIYRNARFRPKCPRISKWSARSPRIFRQETASKLSF